MTDRRANTLLLMLMAIIILLMIAIAGLFLRMNELQRQVLAAVSSGVADVPAQELGLPAGTPTPEFTLSDLAGKSVSLIGEADLGPGAASLRPKLDNPSQVRDT